MATISCRDCGATRTRCPRNTRYCWLCRLIRELDYWRTHTRRCMDCQVVFAPLGGKDRQCSACNPGMSTRRQRCAIVVAAGGLHEGDPVHPSLPVCAGCARDPKLRPTLWDALIKGQANRRAANNHQEA